MRECLVLFVFICILSCKEGPVVPANGLVVYFPFSNNLNDYGPYKFKVTTKKGVFLRDRKGNRSSALYLNGVDEYLTIDHDDILNIGKGSEKETSISLWYKADETQSGGVAYSLIHKGFGESQYQDYHIFFNVNNKMVWSTGNSADPCSHTVIENPESGKWHHLVATLSAKTKSKSIYIDNKHMSRCNYEIKAEGNSEPLYIGAGMVSGSSIPLYFKGLMDEIRIYDRELTEKEIDALFKL